jgi:DNA-binding beta-propeller fold protein YncE
MRKLTKLPIAIIAVFLCAGLGIDAGTQPSSKSGRGASDPDIRATLLRVEETGRTLGVGELLEPLAVAVDQRDNVYVADAMTGKVFRYSRKGESLEFERSSAATALFPIDIGVEGSMVYVLDYAENRVLRYDYKGTFLDILISFDEFEDMHPVSITVGEGSRFITTDVENSSVTIWTPLLEMELSVGEYGWARGAFDAPRKAASLPDGRIAVVESGNRRVQLLTPAGGFERLITLPDSIPFRSPRWVAVDRSGNIFVADAEAGALSIISDEGLLLMRIESYGGEAIAPTSVAIGWDDRMYVADLHAKSVLEYRLHYR